MKGALVIAKTPAFFEEFRGHLRGLAYPYLEDHHSSSLEYEKKSFLYFYDCPYKEPFFLEEIPEEVQLKGYTCVFLVECRSEEAFCHIIGSAPASLDFLVFDGNAALYHPHELSPALIVL